MEDVTKCGKCGADLDGTQRFCATCGQPTGFGNAPGSAPRIPTAAPSSSPPAAANRPSVSASKLLELNDVKATAPPASKLPEPGKSSPVLKAIDAAGLQANPVAVTPKTDSAPPPKSEAAG